MEHPPPKPHNQQSVTTVGTHNKAEIRLTALEVIRGIDTLVGPSELRVTEDPAGGVTFVTQNTPLPFICITLVRNLTGAVVGASTFPVALLQGGVADTFPTALGVSIRTVEVTRILLAANWSCVVGVVAAASAILYLQGGKAPTAKRYVSHRDISSVRSSGEDRSCEEWWRTYLISEEIYDFPISIDRGSLGKNRVGPDKVGDL